MTAEGSRPTAESSGPRRAAPWLWVCLALLVFVGGAETAGVLLRDRLEGRRAVLSQPIEAPPEREGEAPPASPASSRFGPDVREVAVAPPAPGPVLEDAPAQAAKPEPARPEVRPAETSAEGPVAPPAAQAPASAPAGTRVLDVDTFLSQRYLRESESMLSSLGIPHFRREITRKGKGQRLVVPIPDGTTREKALQILEANRYAYRDTAGGFELYFLYLYEVEAAAAAFSREGIQTAASSVDGDRPFWKLYAGPLPEEDALQVQRRLADQGIQTRLRRP